MDKPKESWWKTTLIIIGLVVVLSVAKDLYLSDMAKERSARAQDAEQAPAAGIDPNRLAAMLDEQGVKARAERPPLVEGFERKRLSGGLEIDAPSTWRSLSSLEREIIATGASANARASGIDAEVPKGTLASLRSVPDETYATLTVASFDEPSIPPALLRSASAEQVQAVGAELRKGMAPMMERQNQPIIGEVNSTRVEISGYPAVVLDFRRKGKQGPVKVRQVQVMTDRSEIIYTMSYRESEQALWSGTIDVMQDSIHIPAGL